jgi:hypothetical protein
MTEQIRSSTADQTTTDATLGSSQHKKKHDVLVSKRKQHAPSDQVIIELPPYRGPRSPLDLVAVEFVFGTYLKLFDTPLRPLGLEHRLGLTLNWPKNLGHHR